MLCIKSPHDKGVRQSLASKYGAVPEEIASLLQAALSMNHLVIGISYHVGSFTTVYETFDAAIECESGVRFGYGLGGLKMYILDIGSGFFAGKLFEEAGRLIRSSIERRFGNWSGTETLRVIAEPGRYFAEMTPTLATCVIGKRVRGEIQQYWISDGIFGSMSCAHTAGIKVLDF